jgi:hypothetical protein
MLISRKKANDRNILFDESCIVKYFTISYVI